jgi:biopolymer transport protein ExbD
MNDEGSSEFYIVDKKSKGLNDLNIVPIMDMFICIIFFLLLSTSMMSYTKHVLPPSATKAVMESTELNVPLNPKIYITKKDETYSAILKWEGSNPGTSKLEFQNNFMEKPEFLVNEVKKLAIDFKKIYPKERTVQITMESDLPYQIMISVMDAFRDLMPDIVLTSYKNTDGLKE